MSAGVLQMIVAQHLTMLQKKNVVIAPSHSLSAHYVVCMELSGALGRSLERGEAEKRCLSQ